MNNEVQVGDTIKITFMCDQLEYNGKIGIVQLIDDTGQLHGTWGGLAVIPGLDEFIVLEKVNHEDYLPRKRFE